MQREKELQLVSLEQAIKLKELGFNWITCDYYLKDGTYCGSFDIENWNEQFPSGNGFSAPSIALALKWFRDVKGIKNYFIEFDYPVFNVVLYRNLQKKYNTYEEAESVLLDALIEYVEEE